MIFNAVAIALNARIAPRIGISNALLSIVRGNQDCTVKVLLAGTVPHLESTAKEPEILENLAWFTEVL